MPKNGSKFVLHTDINSNKKYYFTVVASNGREIMTSKKYKMKQHRSDILDTLVGQSFPTIIEEGEIP